MGPLKAILRIVGVCACLLAFLFAAGCGDGGAERVLSVYHAGSLSVPLEELAKAFEAQHPGVQVRRHSYGSVMAIRQLTELGKRPDVVAVSDYRLIDRMLIRAETPWADWNLLFARNEMCIAAGPASPPIGPQDWRSVLTGQDVRIGVSNPNNDPGGYRGLMMLYLAGREEAGESVFAKTVAAPSNIELRQDGRGDLIAVPSALKARGRLMVRPKEVDLIGPLMAGAVDFVLNYRSVAVQHGLQVIELPPSVNLGDPDLDAHYATARVQLFADRSSESQIVEGASIVYGITVPATAQEPELALEFVAMLQSPAGRRILSDCGMRPVDGPTYSEAGGAAELPTP